MPPLVYRGYLPNLNEMSHIPEKWQRWILSIKEFLPFLKTPAYLTVDSKLILPGKTHRRGGIHIDGNYIPFLWGGGWLNGMSGVNITTDQHKQMYLQKGLGILIASNYAACKVWEGKINGLPGPGGNCEHLKEELNNKNSYLLHANKLYWLDSQCIHESMQINKYIKRTLIRITLPME